MQKKQGYKVKQTVSVVKICDHLAINKGKTTLWIEIS